MQTDPSSTVGQIALSDHRTIEVFEKYGIDFCCNGDKTLAQACDKQQVSLDVVEKALLELEQHPKSNETDFAAWPLDQLADYIEKKHHRYIEENLPVLSSYLEKIESVHGAVYPELKKIKALFRESATELTRHMKKEELILFPYIRKLAQMKIRQQVIKASTAADAVQNPVRMMMHDHDTEGDRFRQIANLSDNYTPPFDACTTYQITYTRLREFEKDLHLHIHLENNLLFPGAINTEKELTHE